jgi:hypothetical protein
VKSRVRHFGKYGASLPTKENIGAKVGEQTIAKRKLAEEAQQPQNKH